MYVGCGLGFSISFEGGGTNFRIGGEEKKGDYSLITVVPKYEYSTLVLDVGSGSSVSLAALTIDEKKATKFAAAPPSQGGV